MRLELQKITKQFPGVLANDRISISVDKGQVLGLLGENGAGKTTLMNILSGLYRPDSGKILIDGKERIFRDPAQAIDAGIGMVHQHFMLVPVFDVTESVVLGNEPTKGPLGTFDRSTARAQVVELSKKHGLHVDPDAKIESLPVGVRQRVEILKALYRKSDILVLDEPSAVLTPQETEELFDIIRG
uniref:ATP-binding cassette domain-containing protein n=1 Tax=Candidatus Limnocylindrus sp. TaxID=2802978 RepID=UPI00404B655E